MTMPNPRDRWTEEEKERLRQMFLQHKFPDEIAEALGRTSSSVKSKAHALGITIARLGNQRARAGLKAGGEGK